MGFKKFMGQEEEKTLADEVSECCPTLTRSQRVYAFAILFTIGWLLMFIAAFLVTKIKEKPEEFALCYTFGCICTLLSTVFLYGPWKQIKKMFDPKRRIATSIYLLAMILTIVVAIETAKVLPVILCVCIQCLAGVWYALSYIPYARTAVKKCMGCPA